MPEVELPPVANWDTNRQWTEPNEWWKINFENFRLKNGALRVLSTANNNRRRFPLKSE